VLREPDTLLSAPSPLRLRGAQRAVRQGVVGALGAGAPAHRLDAARARVRCAALSARSGVVGGQAVGVPAGPPRARVRSGARAVLSARLVVLSVLHARLGIVR
jgi:hypothetical protein